MGWTSGGEDIFHHEDTKDTKKKRKGDNFST